jgi:hypothetical protein
MRKGTNFFLGISLAFVLALTTVGCDENEKNAAPQLPPASTMVMDFSDFAATKSAMDTVSFQNWTYAATCATYWNIVIGVTCYIPVAAFHESFKHDAEYLGNNTWEWAYGVQTQAEIYTARLIAVLDADSVTWKMYLTKSGLLGFTDFLWYEGKSANDLTGGWWMLKYRPDSAFNLLKIDWSRTTDDTEASLKYTYALPGAPENGNYIEYGIHPASDLGFNAYYYIVDMNLGQSVDIEWNRDSNVGRVKKYGESIWSCWDENLYDMVCP